MNLPGRNLPIWDVKQAILDALREYPVAIIAAETGSGKSTQIPQMLLETGYAATGMIGVTQPRRVAAASVARRIAFEQGVSIGQEVGFQVRFEDLVSSNTRIKVATEGIFLQEAKFDPCLSRYSVLMLDEVHERSIDIDLLLGLAQKALAQRDDFRVIVSSATINIQALAGFFNGQAKVIECKGRTWPITHYFEEISPIHTFRRPYYGGDRYEMPEFVADKAAQIIEEGERGDILVFLPGLDDLERARRQFGKIQPEVKTLLAYGDMPLEDLETLMQPNGRQRVIFSTNVAETSVTPVGVTTVINSGQVKKDYCDTHTGITSIKLVSTSKSSDLQRSGRAGRLGPGVCYHLFTKADHERHLEFDVPAIKRTHLGNAILTLASIGVKDFGSFPLLDKPDTRQIELAWKTLQKIGALDEENNLTDYGRQIAKFPLVPELAHFLLQAAHEDAIGEMATFLAMYESRPMPKVRKNEKPPAYLALTSDAKSDPEIYLRLWELYYESGFSWDWAKEVGLNPKRMIEARDVRAQLLQIATDQGLQISQAECDLAKLKRALVKARPDQICIGAMYNYSSLIGDLEGIFIHPSSRLFNCGPRILWYFAAQTTTKLFAQCCFKVGIEELKALFPDRVTVQQKMLPRTFSREIVVAEDVYFDGNFVEQHTVEERPMTADEASLYDSLGYFTRTLTPEEMAEALRQREEAAALMRRLEVKQNARCSRAKKLLAGLPLLPEGVSIATWSLDVMIRRALEHPEVTDADLARAEEDIERLKQGIKNFNEETAAKEKKIEACQEDLDLHVAVYLDKCPLCSSVALEEANACDCVASCFNDQLDLSGSLEKDLVKLVTDGGEVLARIFIDCGEGKPRRVRRVVGKVTSPFNDLRIMN